jgi:antitoxin component of MazEF toxin-antitoxin module
MFELGDYKMIRKVFQNSNGTYLMSIPIDYVREMGLTKDDAVNVTLAGTTLHVTKIHIE